MIRKRSTLLLVFYKLEFAIKRNQMIINLNSIADGEEKKIHYSELHNKLCHYRLVAISTLMPNDEFMKINIF